MPSPIFLILRSARQRASRRTQAGHAAARAPRAATDLSCRRQAMQAGAGVDAAGGKEDGDRRAAAGCARQVERTAVQFHQALAERQAEAAAFLGSAVEVADPAR